MGQERRICNLILGTTGIIWTLGTVSLVSRFDHICQTLLILAGANSQDLTNFSSYERPHKQTDCSSFKQA